MDPFVGEIRIMPYSFVANGWAQCNGQLLAINQNTALFALLGIQYGGDGRTTFALPNLNGRAVVGAGQGAGLSNYPQGLQTGAETVALTQAQLPAHTHDLGTATVAVGGTATATTPAGGYFGIVPKGESFGGGATGTMATNMVNAPTNPIGSGQAHDNRQPYLVLSYVIATQGIFPQRP